MPRRAGDTKLRTKQPDFRHATTSLREDFTASDGAFRGLSSMTAIGLSEYAGLQLCHSRAKMIGSRSEYYSLGKCLLV